MKTCSSIFAPAWRLAYSHRIAKNGFSFTLIELLVVIAIIMLLYLSNQFLAHGYLFSRFFVLNSIESELQHFTVQIQIRPGAGQSFRRRPAGIRNFHAVCHCRSLIRRDSRAAGNGHITLWF